MIEGKSLKDMTMGELAEHFDRNAPKVTGERTGATLMVRRWEKGCINDLLRTYLKEHAYPYINTLGGVVWFTRDGATWECTEAEVSKGLVTYYLLQTIGII